MWLVLALCSLAAGHPDSRSSSRVTVAAERVEVELRFQARSLIEALAIDADGDGALAASELAAARDAVEAYLALHYQVFAVSPAWQALEPREAIELTLVELELEPPQTGEETWVLARSSGQRAEPFEELVLRSHLFFEQNPLHRDQCQLVWNAGERAGFLFPENGEEWHFRPADARRPGVARAYVENGWEHILGGYDHLCFVAALVLAAARLRSVLAVVTGFTLAHSLTLALAALDVVSVRSDWVEMAIALSIAYVALQNLLARTPSTRWVEAVGFGLVHGLGFAGALADSLMFEELRYTALIAFNVGVELGQLAVVLLLALILARLPGRRAGLDGRAFLAPHLVRRLSSIAIAIVGLYLFVERAGWIARGPA